MRYAALVLLIGCATPPSPVPDRDAGLTCDDACADGRRRGCEWAQDAEDGATCEVVCGDAERLLPGAFLGALGEC